MPRKVTRSLNTIKRYGARHKKSLWVLIGLLVVVPSVFVLVSNLMIVPYGKYILNPLEKASMAQTDATVGLVLGAGITKQGKPYRELQARLDVAADALHKGYVSKLLLSGDNRFHDYNEPQAMQDYLVNVKHIPKNKLQVDDAGRSTYESCERAAKVFGLHKTIIFSARSHLPRAIFTCRHFGIEAYGIASNVEANNAVRREILARAKAVFNIYIYGEDTILGPPIKL